MKDGSDRTLDRVGAIAGIAAVLLLVSIFTVLPAIGAGSVMGDEVDGGILGGVLLLGYVGLMAWIVGVSVSLWRRSGRAEPVPLPVAEAS